MLTQSLPENKMEKATYKETIYYRQSKCVQDVQSSFPVIHKVGNVGIFCMACNENKKETYNS